MADVKAQFPIGKTQWAKWNEMQRRAFNSLREQGRSFEDAVALANTMPDVFEEIEPKKKSILDVIEDVADVAATVASVATSVAPVVAVAKTVAKATKKKGK